MGTLSRTKGKAFERACAKDLRDALGLEKDSVRRGIQSRGGGGEVPDVIVDGLPIHWECKHTDAAVVLSALRQASRDVVVRKAVELPVVVVKRNRQTPIVVMYAADMCVFLTAWKLRAALSPIAVRSELDYAAQAAVQLGWAEFLVMLKVIPRAP